MTVPYGWSTWGLRWSLREVLVDAAPGRGRRLHHAGPSARYGRVGRAHCRARPPSEPRPPKLGRTVAAAASSWPSVTAVEHSRVIADSAARLLRELPFPACQNRERQYQSVRSGGCRGQVPFVPPSPSWSRHSWPAWGRASTALLGEVIDVHGEQNGSVYQEVTLSGSDVAPVSPLAQYRAGVLECCLDCKHSDHSPHLQPRYTARGAGRGRGFSPHRRPQASTAREWCAVLARPSGEGCAYHRLVGLAAGGNREAAAGEGRCDSLNGSPVCPARPCRVGQGRGACSAPAQNALVLAQHRRPAKNADRRAERRLGDVLPDLLLHSVSRRRSR
jgi:hypothetical protein